MCMMGTIPPMPQHSQRLVVAFFLLAVRFNDGSITRTSSGPEANMDDPDAYFDQVGQCLLLNLSAY